MFYPTATLPPFQPRLVDHLSCLQHCAVCLHSVAGQELLEVLLQLLGLQATLLGAAGTHRDMENAP